MPLHLACAPPDSAWTVTLLLAAGAEPLAKDNDGNSPRDISVANGKTDLVELIGAELARRAQA